MGNVNGFVLRVCDHLDEACMLPYIPTRSTGATVSSAQEPAAPFPAPSSQRLRSLDVLRGLTVALMILVNNAGDGHVSYPQLRHSVWNGCTLTDLVFPTFLFIVGASIALAFHSRLARGASRPHILLQVAKRSLLILGIGLLLNALPFFHFSDLRYYGVLQRIALCYALASTLYLFGGVLTCAAAAVLALAGYWFLLLHVPVPGLGMPGVNLPILDPFGNLASWLDRAIVPASHLYHRGVYDPEGLLGTLPSYANTLFGILAASWLQSGFQKTVPTGQTAIRKALVLFVAGVVLTVCGLLWAPIFPLNKRLWTSSFVLFSTGISTALFSLLYWAIDGVLQLRKGLTPWLVFGSNAVTAYVFSELLAIVLDAIPMPGKSPVGENLQQFLYRLLPTWLGPPPFVSMLYSIFFVGVCFLPVFVLYRRKIFLKL
jgi:predicted acyltransferase